MTVIELDTEPLDVIYVYFDSLVKKTEDLYKQYKKEFPNNENYRVYDEYLEKIKDYKKYKEDDSKSVLNHFLEVYSEIKFPGSSFLKINKMVSKLREDLRIWISNEEKQTIESLPDNYISYTIKKFKTIIYELFYKFELIIFDDLIRILISSKLFKRSDLDETHTDDELLELNKDDDIPNVIREENNVFWRQILIKGGISRMIYLLYGFDNRYEKRSSISSTSSTTTFDLNKELEKVLKKDTNDYSNNEILFGETPLAIQDLHNSLHVKHLDFIGGSDNIDNFKIYLEPNDDNTINSYEQIKKIIMNSSIIYITLQFNDLEDRELIESEKLFKIDELKRFLRRDIKSKLTVQSLIYLTKPNYKKVIDYIIEKIKSYNTKFKLSYKNQTLYNLIKKYESQEAYIVLLSLLIKEIILVYLINKQIKEIKESFYSNKDLTNLKKFKYSETSIKSVDQIIEELLKELKADKKINKQFDINLNIDKNSNIYEKQDIKLNKLYIIHKKLTNKSVKINEEEEIKLFGQFESIINDQEESEGGEKSGKKESEGGEKSGKKEKSGGIKVIDGKIVGDFELEIEDYV